MILASWDTAVLELNYVNNIIKCFQTLTFIIYIYLFSCGAFTEHITSVNSLVMTSVACGEAHSMALNECGQLFTWGSDSCCQLGEV